MAVRGLVCRECGRRYRAEPIFVCEHCFGPLEVEYELGDLSAETLRDRIAAGPAADIRGDVLAHCANRFGPHYVVELFTC